MSDATQVLRIFADAEAVLAAQLPNYEVRPPQQVGAQAVETAFAQGSHLLLMAGCGVGKSFMGLIPMILSGKRGVISTATKALQDQITRKDLPFLQQYLANFRWAMLQGRSNYFCSNRASLVADEDPDVRYLLEYANQHKIDEGFSGLRSDFPFEISGAAWARASSDSEECSDLQCRNLGGCYAHYARQEARDAQIVVINHALLCNDLVLQTEADFSMLGDYEYVFADEVHELDSYVKSSLGVTFSEGSIASMTAQVHNFAGRHLPARFSSKIDQAEAEITMARNELWMAFASMMPAAQRGRQPDNTLRLKGSMYSDYEAEWGNLLKALVQYRNLLASIPMPVDDDKAARRWRLLSSRSARTAARFQALIMDTEDQSVRWLERKTVKRRGMDEERLVINSQPVEVGTWLDEHLFQRVRSFVGMSATLKPFEFIERRLGLQGATSVDVGTMFDYPNQAVLCVPKGFPEPAGKTQPAWETAAPAAMRELVVAAGGGALLLFTSKAAMERAYAQIAPNLPFTCLKQGTDPVPVLARKFMEDTDSVLFATRSFMTGIDVQGHSLRLVVLDKLVFQSPADPVFEAECDLVERRGGSGFFDVSLPLMELVVQQAAGRLIRTQKDRGAFVVLDSRLLSKSYGSRVLRNLPPMKLVKNIGEVNEFFGQSEEIGEDFEDDDTDGQTFYDEEPF